MTSAHRAFVMAGLDPAIHALAYEERHGCPAQGRA
jgi:hypothetical protein